MTETFLEYAKYYDCIYRDKDYKAEANFFAGLIRKHETNSSRSVLEFGAGTGRHQPYFRVHQFDVAGVEISEEMCQIGRANGAEVQQGDFRAYSHFEKVDVVLALFHVMSYMTSEHDINGAFSTAAANLVEGGLLVFDVWHEAAVLFQEPETRVRHFSCDDFSFVRLAEPKMNKNDKTVTIDYSIFSRQVASGVWSTTQESHSMRYFSDADIRLFASKNGLLVVDSLETLTGNKPSANTWGVTYCLVREP